MDKIAYQNFDDCEAGRCLGLKIVVLDERSSRNPNTVLPAQSVPSNPGVHEVHAFTLRLSDADCVVPQ